MFKRILLGLMVLLLLGAARGGAQPVGRVAILQMEGPLTPSLEEYLRRGITTAQRRGDVAVVILLNTPGGSLEIAQKMVEDIRNSPLPVAVYVYPRGAMAGSAGLFILLAGHWAAMAPDTAVGASSPVSAEGKDLGKTLEQKAKEITKALVRSLAARRGEKAVNAAEQAIENAKAYSAQEALSLGMIDFIAATPNELLTDLAGKSAETVAGEVTLPPSLTAEEIKPAFSERFFHTLSNPNLVFILLGLGIQAILIGIWHPHNWVAWFVGLVAVLLAAYGLSLLPVNWVGLAFLLLSFGMFAVDVKAHTHGALTAAGLAAFIFGALTLFNTPTALPSQRVSVPLVVGTGLLAAALSTGAVILALKASQQPVKTGLEQVHRLVGKVGVARTHIRPGERGTVQIGGELWTALLTSGTDTIAPNEPVEVVEVRGVHLIVRPAKGKEGDVVE